MSNPLHPNIWQQSKWHTLWGKNLHPFYFLNNFVKSRSILIIFGTQIPQWICNRMLTKLSTSPNEYHYTTLWNTACVNIHNRSNASIKRHGEIGSYGQTFAFDTCIKMISPLINCLINDTLSCEQRFFRHFSWMSLWCVPLTCAKCQFSWRSWQVVLCVPGALF